MAKLKKINFDMKHEATICKILAIMFFALYSLYCFVLLPLSTKFNSNIVYADTLLPAIMEFIYTIVELLAVSFGYASIVYIVYRFGLAKCRKVFDIILIASLYKYVANTVVSWFDGGFYSDELLTDILNMIIYTALDVLQALIVGFAAYKIIGKFDSGYTVAKKSAEKLDGKYPERDTKVYPFSGLFNFKNPLIKSALAGGILIATVKILMRLWYDIIYTFYHGLPSSFSEVLYIIFNYVFDCVSGALCYFVIVFTVLKFFDLYLKQKNNFS